MRSKAKAFLSCMLVLATIVVSQIAFLAPASAAEGEAVDLFVYIGSASGTFMQGQNLNNSWVQVCAEGLGSLKSIDFSASTTNVDLDSFATQSANEWNTATNLGSIDSNHVWTGQIDPGQCLTLSINATINGSIGDNASLALEVQSSTLLDDSLNVDPDLSDNTSTLTQEIVTPVYEVNLASYIGTSFTHVSDGFVYTNQIRWNICSQGFGSVESITLDIDSTNWINTNVVVQPEESQQGVTDRGTLVDGVWNGRLDQNQCIQFSVSGEVSGAVGDTATWSMIPTASTLVGGAPNTDTDSSDDLALLELDIVVPVEEVDLNVYVGSNNTVFPNEGTFTNTWLRICTGGYGSVERIEFDIDAVNWTPEEIRVDPFQDTYSTPTEKGTIGLDGVWTGQIDAGQCMVINEIGPITGEIGDIVSWTVTVLSSDLLGGEENVEPYLNNQTMTISAPIGETGDLAIQTRLLPESETGDSSDASYEVEIQNVGAGIITDSSVGLYYVLPDGASLLGLTDLDETDALTPIGCQSMGPIEEMGPAFSAYSGEVIQCLLQGPVDGINPGSSYPLRLDLEAIEGFTSGETEVLGVVLSGNISEPDSASFVMEFSAGRDGFRLNINNIMHLTYDSNELQVTINRCEGQAAETTVDEACFTVEFSKPVWAASFEESDLVIVGGGEVSSFEMVSNTQWIVRITGMTPGGTIRLLLGTASVADYSAVLNGVSVLGENTVRYAALGDSTSAENSGSESNSADSTTSDGVDGSSAVATTNDELVAAAEKLISLGTASGLVAEIPELFSAQLDKVKLLLGSWSIMKSNVLDFAFLIVNVSGAMALIIILRNRRRKLA